MSKDFNWSGTGDDADSIILSYQPPTAVYSTRGGGVCIRQQKDYTEEYDPEILLTPQGALAVAWALIEEAHLVGLPSPSLSLMAESEHWPPPIRRPERPGDDTTAGPGSPRSDETPPPGPLLAAMEAKPPANDAKPPAGKVKAC